MTKSNKQKMKSSPASSSKFQPYKEVNNTNNNTSVTDEQLAKDLFATPKPTVIIDNNKTQP